MSRQDDIRMLRAILDDAASFDEERAESFSSTHEAFSDMICRLERGGRDLTDKQRAWVKGVYENVCGEPTYANEWSAGKIPKGRDVETPEVLRNLPKRPPKRAATSE